MALALEDVDEADLLLGRHARDHADPVDLLVGLLVRHLRELRARDRTALDAELPRDRARRDRVVARDHPDLDPGVVRGGDRGLRRRARRVHDPDKRQQRETVRQREQVGAGIEVGGGEVLAGGGHDAQALRGEALVLGEVPGLEVLVHRGGRELRVEVRPRAREQLVGRALDEAAHHVLAGLVGHAVERRHQLVRGVERQLGDARVALARGADVQAALLPEDDQGALGRVADHLARGREHGVTGEDEREHERLERHLGLAGDVLDLPLGRVAAARDRVAGGPGSSARRRSSG